MCLSQASLKVNIVGGSTWNRITLFTISLYANIQTNTIIFYKYKSAVWMNTFINCFICDVSNRVNNIFYKIVIKIF